MSFNKAAVNSKLFSLKKWLLVPETARYLSILFSEDVKEADVLRLALDKHITLSVNFVNAVYSKQGKIVSSDEIESFRLNEKFSKAFGISDLIPQGIPIHDNIFIKINENQIFRIDGVWDLCMIGSERLDVEHRYQMLTGGPDVKSLYLDGVFLEKDGKGLRQLQERFPDEHLRDLQKNDKDRADKPGPHPENYYPAGVLPDDSVLVVRTQALIDFQKRLSQIDSEKTASLDSRAETTYLNIIGAMLETFVHKDHGNLAFSSETKLREFLSGKYDGFKGLTERTLAAKFAAAKKAIREELD